MAQSSVSLVIYDDQDGVIASYTVHRIRWGIIEDVVELSEQLSGKSEKDAISAMGQFLLKVFPDLSAEHLRLADVSDVKTCFKQIVAMVHQIEGNNSKNP